MQLSKTTTFQLTCSNEVDEKSSVFEINRTSTFGRKNIYHDRAEVLHRFLARERLFERYKFIYTFSLHRS